MAERKRRALLGRIAEFGWFIQQGEPAATRSMAMLLEDKPLREALLRHLEGRTGIGLSSVVVFIPEMIHQDGGRPDLEGHDAESRPVLVVEAKFGATLSIAQVRSYLMDQQLRLGPSVKGAFVLLVPKTREAEAKRAVETALQELQDQDFHMVSVGTAVATWDQWIDVWDDALRDQPDAALVSDLEQFRAMCMTLGGLIMEPLGEAALGPAWRERKEDLRQIVDEVTRRFFTFGERVLPMQSEPGYEPTRYFSGGDADPGISCSVGIGSRFADDGATPFWLRYHRHTPGFQVVRARLYGSRFASDIRTDDGHIWLPLAASPDVAGPELVEQLASQVSEIVAATSPPRLSTADTPSDEVPNRAPPSHPRQSFD